MKLKKNLCLTSLTVCLMVYLSSCTNEEENSDMPIVDVNVKIKGLDISFEEYRESRGTATDAQVAHIAFAVFDNNGTKVYEKIQNSEDEDFNTFKCSLPALNYQMVAVAHKGGSTYGNVSIKSPSLVQLPKASIMETYSVVKTENLTGVTEKKDVELDVSRATTMLKVTSTVAQPAEVAKMRIKIGDTSKPVYESLSFDPSTGLLSNFGTNGYYMRTKDISTSTGLTTFYTFETLLPSAECTMPVEIDILNSEDEVLNHHVISETKFYKDRKTIATGALFDSNVAWNGFLNFNTSWGEDYNISF